MDEPLLTMRRMILIVAATIAAGCVKASDFQCAADSVCIHADVQGTCESNGYCSFPDTSCSSGKRFGALSGSSADQCVGAGSGSDGGVPDGLGCPVGYATLSGIPNHAYRRLPAGTWTVVRDACRADGANVYLTIPNDAVELQAILTLAGGDTWLGIEDMVTEGSFETVLGGAATFLPWAAGQPDDAANSDCVEGLASQTYDDRRCSSSVIAVCECEP